ncbi:hypothetical protein NC796_24845 [Aliifodinibius sp. S!AR15-10]|uniref:hypothetical protein n=1 Tax=Aliifodinibius sp. S!AR15-10 TaxID=2950437 RepID=UPI002862464F|nr:hypothetical protein [Aliifodinibius sp. S!AR15-10]MDR8394400.1 hypothetical protein [Aliifodinibius sp. S!AR15-10]
MMETERLNNSAVDLSDFELRVLGREWNERLLQLTQESPVEAGKFRIYFDRSPDIFAIPQLTSYKYRCLGLFKGDELLGYAFASYQKRYVNRRIADVIYLGNIHVFRKGLGRVFLRLLSDRLSGIIQKNREVKYIYAYILEQNIPAMKLSGHGYFSSRVVSQISMINILLLKAVRLSRTYTIRRAKLADVDSIVELLKEEHRSRFLAPGMSKEIFVQNLAERPQFGIENYYLAVSGDDVVGVCSVWDMTALKKNRIQTYGPTMRLMRWVYNMVAPILGAASLPTAGEALKDITIAEFAVKDRDPEIMEALLRHVYNHYRKLGYHSIIFGSSSDDPLLKAAGAFLSREVRSNVILGTLQGFDSQEIISPALIYADAVQI